MEVTRKTYREYLEDRLYQIDRLADKIDNMEEGIMTASDVIALGQQKDFIMKELYQISEEELSEVSITIDGKPIQTF